MVTRLVRTVLLAFLLHALPGFAAQDIFVEAELSPAEVRVNAQAVYRLRVWHAVDLADLQITGPSVRLADLRQIGEKRVYESQRDGRRYRVHERSYAVFPFASGTLEMSGAHASGRIAAPKAAGSDGRKPVRLDAPARALVVLPVGLGAEGVPWLPARDLKLTEAWESAGSTQRRTIRIEATGVDAAQLPALQLLADGVTMHAEAARLENRFVGEQNVAVREQTFVMTPTRPGDIAIPLLQLPWWHTELDSPALATLPGRSVRGDPVAVPAAQPASTIPAGMMVSAAAALLVCLFALVAWRRRAELRATSQLRHACRTGNVVAVRDGLLQWASRVWPHAPPLTLSALAGRLQDPGARRALGTVERALYGSVSAECNPAMLKAVVRAVTRDGR